MFYLKVEVWVKVFQSKKIKKYTANILKITQSCLLNLLSPKYTKNKHLSLISKVIFSQAVSCKFLKSTICKHFSGKEDYKQSIVCNGRLSNTFFSRVFYCICQYKSFNSFFIGFNCFLWMTYVALFVWEYRLFCWIFECKQFKFWICNLAHFQLRHSHIKLHTEDIILN